MASRIETFDVTIPAATAIATPQSTALPFNEGVVQRLEIRVPPGPSGLMGFRITHSGEVVIPNNRDNWIITDDEKIPWDLDDYPVGSAWGITAYNTDIYPHTVYLRFLVIETKPPVGVVVPILAISPIASSAVEPGVGGV